MDALIAGVDWEELFLPSTPILEIILRGSITYLALFTMLRFILKRQSGAISLGDLLVVVLIADASQNAMAGSYRSIPDGILLVATIIFWNYALDWLGYHFKSLQPFVFPPQLQLVKDGELLWRNMRRELITEGELMSHLRKQGIDDVSEVKEAFMEGDGRISIVTYETPKRQDSPEREGVL